MIALCFTYLCEAFTTVGATVTTFESGEASMNLNTLMFNGIPISILGRSSNSSVSVFTSFGGIVSSSDSSSGSILTSASASVPNINASAFTNNSQVQAQAAFSLIYDGWNAELSGQATATTTIQFLTLGAGELTILGDYYLNGDFGGIGHRWDPFVGVSFAIAGFQPDPKNLNTSGHSDWSFLRPLPHTATFGLHGYYEADQIGTLTITSFTGFRYSGLSVPEPSTLLFLISGLAVMGLWQWRQGAYIRTPQKLFQKN